MIFREHCSNDENPSTEVKIYGSVVDSDVNHHDILLCNEDATRRDKNHHIIIPKKSEKVWVFSCVVCGIII